MNSKKPFSLVWLIILVVGVVAAVTVGALLFYSTSVQNYDSLAKCLAEKGAVMYGAKWCAYCNKEKQLFGASFSYINYVECPENIEKCIAFNIESYPTWTFSDGNKLVGFQTPEALSEISGCPIK